MRLHAPLPQVVIVQVIGAVGSPSVVLLAERIAQQLRRAADVVLDLGEVSLLECDGVHMLLELHREAGAHSARLHITGADHPAVRDPLRLAGLEQVLMLAPSADELVALLLRPGTSGGACPDAVVGRLSAPDLTT